MLRFTGLIAALFMSLTLAAGEEAVYDLHEWGVFSIARDEAWAMSDMRAEWATFPEFFYRVWPDKRLPFHGAVKKPVIYFHAEKPGRIQLTVRFAEGRPLVWWPAALSPANGGLDFGIGVSPRDRLLFNLDLDVRDENSLPDRVHEPRDVKPGHWIETLRKVIASTVTASADWGGKSTDYEKESFVYYDGLMKAPAAPAVKVEKDAVVLENPNDFPMLDVMVIDNTTKSPRIAKAWTDKIDAGKQSARIDLDSPPAVGLNGIRAAFCKRLAAAGLNADEAEALAKVWEQGLFKHDGLSVFYRIPQDIYEKWLPLTAKPAPKNTVRVGIVLHEHLEPELNERVEKLVAKLAVDDFEERQAVRSEIAQIGGAAFPVLEKHYGDKDAEIAKACRYIVNALSTKPALEEKTDSGLRTEQQSK